MGVRKPVGADGLVRSGRSRLTSRLTPWFTSSDSPSITPAAGWPRPRRDRSAAPGRADEVPDQAEVAELGCQVDTRSIDRVAAEVIEGAIDPTVESFSAAACSDPSDGSVARARPKPERWRSSGLLAELSSVHERASEGSHVTGATRTSGSAADMETARPVRLSTARAASGSPPKAGQNSWNEHQAHSGPGLGRKSSCSQARSTADQMAPTLVRRPRVDCSVGTVVIASGSRQVQQLHLGRAPPEQLLAEERVEVDAAEPALLVALGRRPARLVVGDDELAVGVELEPVDDAAQAQVADARLEHELEADRA